MKQAIKLGVTLIVFSIIFFSCISSQQVTCPDYSKNSKIKHTPAQAYKPTKYKPPKVTNKHKLGRVKTSSKQISSPDIDVSTSKEIETQIIHMPTMANVIQPIEKQSIVINSTYEAINPDIGLSTGSSAIADLTNSRDVEKLKFSAENELTKSSNKQEHLQTSPNKPTTVEEVDDASFTPPLVVKSRKEKRQVIRNIRRAINNYIEAEPDGEAKPVTGFAVSALVLGIVSLFIFPFIAGPLAIIFGGIAMKRANSNPNKEGRGLAIAGLICGIVGTVGGLVLLTLV